MPIWRSRSLRPEKSWTSAWSAHEVVATSYWHLGRLLGWEKIGSDRETSTTKFYCKTLSCWSWLCYDLFMGRFQSCVESETSWDCRTQREGIRGQRVGIRRQCMDGREDRINITIAICLIGVTFMFSYISRYAYISVWVSAGHSHHRKTRIGLDICENWVANFRRFGECKMPMQQHTNSRMLIKILKC